MQIIFGDNVEGQNNHKYIHFLIVLLNTNVGGLHHDSQSKTKTCPDVATRVCNCRRKIHNWRCSCSKEIKSITLVQFGKTTSNILLINSNTMSISNNVKPLFHISSFFLHILYIATDLTHQLTSNVFEMQIAKIK